MCHRKQTKKAKPLLTANLAEKLMRKHMSKEEYKETTELFYRRSGSVAMLVNEEQHVFNSEKEVVIWLRRLAKQLRTGGEA